MVKKQRGKAAPASLAEKVQQLFDVVRPPEGDEYTHEEVASALRAAGGPTISATYVWQLRKGIRDNPTKHHIEALADFFGVAPSYFFDEDAGQRIDAELDLLVAVRDPAIRALALGANGLSPASLDAVRAIIDNARQLEGLPALTRASTARGR
jgi:transcriptional regulator with XRE-family HTH domain